MSAVPSAVSDLRERIRVERALLFNYSGYLDMESGEYVRIIDPERYRDLWTTWQSRLPLHGPPDGPPPVRTLEEAHRALDVLLRKLDELFGPVPADETPDAVGGMPLKAVTSSGRRESPPPLANSANDPDLYLQRGPRARKQLADSRHQAMTAALEAGVTEEQLYKFMQMNHPDLMRKNKKNPTFISAESMMTGYSRYLAHQNDEPAPG